MFLAREGNLKRGGGGSYISTVVIIGSQVPGSQVPQSVLGFLNSVFVFGGDDRRNKYKYQTKPCTLALKILKSSAILIALLS